MIQEYIRYDNYILQRVPVARIMILIKMRERIFKLKSNYLEKMIRLSSREV